MSFSEGNIVHYTTLYIVFGLPAVYMQVVIGQYSQLGATFMKHMIPIGHGFSYILAINAATDTIENGIIMGNIVMYLLSTVQEQLLWMNCPVNHNEGCWGKESIRNCSKDCINEDIEISSQVFYKYVKFSVLIALRLIKCYIGRSLCEILIWRQRNQR